LVALSLVLTGCTSAPYESCFGEGGHAGWRGIEAPAERDALLDLVARNPQQIQCVVVTR
jgi:hypothetical protein